MHCHNHWLTLSNLRYLILSSVGKMHAAALTIHLHAVCKTEGKTWYTISSEKWHCLPNHFRCSIAKSTFGILVRICWLFRPTKDYYCNISSPAAGLSGLLWNSDVQQSEGGAFTRQRIYKSLLGTGWYSKLYFAWMKQKCFWKEWASQFFRGHLPPVYVGRNTHLSGQFHCDGSTDQPTNLIICRSNKVKFFL